MSGWQGPDAAAFDHRWRAQHQPTLRATADGLGGMARRLDQQASEQLRASSGAGAGSITDPGGTGPIGAAARLPTLPRIEDRYLGNLELRVGPVGVGLVGELAVQHLGGSRRRVVLTETVAGGGVLSAGSSADLGIGGPHGAGATATGGSAEARLRAGAVQRQSWEVDEDRVDDLVARIAAEHAGVAITGRPAPLVAAAAGADTLAEWITGNDPGWDVAASVSTSVPSPTVHEELVEVELAAAAGAGLGLGVAQVGGRGQGAGSVRVGTMHRGADSSTVLELQGSATAALTSTLLRRLGVALPPDAHRGVAVRLELPRVSGTDAPTHAMVHVSSTSDTEVHDVLARIDLGGPDAAATVRSLADAVGSVGRGDLGGALTHLDGVTIAPDRVTVAATTGTLSGTSGRAGAAAGIGVGAGAGVRGQVLHLERN